MPATPQSAAIQVANALISEANNSILLFYNNHTSLMAQWTEQGIATILSKLGTVPLNPDGSLGTTPDPAPVPGNPIDPAKYPLTKSLSSNDITAIKTILDQIKLLIDGNAVAAQTGAHGILNKAVGG